MYQQNGFYNPNFSPYQHNIGAVPDMLNQFKGQYQQPIPQMQQNMGQPIQQNFQTMPTQTKSNNELIWVQGEAGAKGYLVAPNNTVILWDTESPTVYVKSADSNGMPSMKTLDFTERTNAPQMPQNAPNKHECKCGDEFVTKEQFEALQGKLEALESKFQETAVVQVTKSNKSTKKGDAE